MTESFKTTTTLSCGSLFMKLQTVLKYRNKSRPPQIPKATTP